MSNKITLQDCNQIIEISKLFLDSPYLFGWNGNLPWDPTDCSRFVQVVLENVWITVERNSAKQGEMFSNTWNMHEDLSKAEICDLIFLVKKNKSKFNIKSILFL